MKPIFQRMLRAIKLDQQLFEEIVADPSIQGQSVWVVAIFSMATAFGSFSMAGGTAVNIALITTILAWYVWAFSIFYFGSRMFSTSENRTDRKTIMRVVAFASAPGIVRLLGIIPKTTVIVLIISTIWILIATVIGLKKVFAKTNTGMIAALCVATWMAASIFQAVMIVTLVSVFGIPSSGS